MQKSIYAIPQNTWIFEDWENVCIATVEYDYVKLKQKPLNHTFFGEYLFGVGPNQKQY